MSDLLHQLQAPFQPDEVKWKPQSVKGNRALAVAYVNARAVMDRLDEVFGVGGWQDEYTPLADGQIKCRLSAFVGTSWVYHEDVGGESEQPDGGDRQKSAFSDALKRAAVKFGIGRYLYRLPMQWCDYDVQKRQFTKKPELPSWAIPKSPPQNKQAKQPKQESSSLATTIRGIESRLVKDGLCQPNDLVAYLFNHLGEKYGKNLEAWPGTALDEAMKHVAEYEKWLKDNIRINPDDMAALERELVRTGVQWEKVRTSKQLDLGENGSPSDLTVGGFSWLMDVLGKRETIR